MSDDHLLDQWGQLMDPNAPMPTVQPGLGRRGFLGALAGGVAALAMSRGAGSSAAAQAPTAAPIPPTPAAVPMVKVRVPHSISVADVQDSLRETAEDANKLVTDEDEMIDEDVDNETAFDEAENMHDDIREMAGEELHEMDLTPEEIEQIRDGNTEFIEHDSANISHAASHYYHELIMPKDLYEKRFKDAYAQLHGLKLNPDDDPAEHPLQAEDFNPLAEMEAVAKEYAGEAPAADWTKQIAGAASQLIKKIPDHVDRMARTGNGLGDAFKSFMDDSIKRQAVHNTLHGDEPTRAADKQTRELDQLLLQHATPLPDDLVVFRPLDRERIGLRDDDSAVGKHLADRSYLSATSDPERAAELSKQTGAVMAVHLPKGTPVLHHNGDVLLPRGTRLRVTGHDQASDGTHLLTAEHEGK